jgi:hypothetical protein
VRQKDDEQYQQSAVDQMSQPTAAVMKEMRNVSLNGIVIQKPLHPLLPFIMGGAPLRTAEIILVRARQNFNNNFRAI